MLKFSRGIFGLLKFPRSESSQGGSADLGVGVRRVSRDDVLHLAKNVSGIGRSIGIQEEIVREQRATEGMIVL